MHRSWCFSCRPGGCRDPDARARPDPLRCRMELRIVATGDRPSRESRRGLQACEVNPRMGCGAPSPSSSPPRERIALRREPTRFSSPARTCVGLIHTRPTGPHPAPMPRGRLDLVMTLIPALLSATLMLHPGALTDPRALRGQGVWPLQPTPAVVNGFDAPDSQWGSGHRGVDLAGMPSQVVRAALPGRVAYAGPLAGRGVVVVSHGETRTTYERAARQSLWVRRSLRALASAGWHFPAHTARRGPASTGAGLPVRSISIPSIWSGRVGSGYSPCPGSAPVPTPALPPAASPRAGGGPASRAISLPVLLELTRAGALAGRPSGAAHW